MIKRPIANTGDTVFNHHFFDILMIDYRTLIVINIVIFHRSRTADIQRSILIQFPCQIIFNPVGIALFQNGIAIWTITVTGIAGACFSRFCCVMGDCVFVIIRNQIRLIAEITFFQGRFAAQRNGFQAAAILKHSCSNVCDTVRNGDIGQTGATIKRINSNACDTAWNGDAS